MNFSDEWKQEITYLISVLEKYLNEECISGKTNYSKRDVFEICLYGNAGHYSKRERYKELTSKGKYEEIIQDAFHEVILTFSCIIMSLANASRKELRNKGLISDEEFAGMQEQWNKGEVQNNWMI